MLPPLPKEVEYRIVAGHLILRDTGANLIVDFIPEVTGVGRPIVNLAVARRIVASVLVLSWSLLLTRCSFRPLVAMGRPSIKGRGLRSVRTMIRSLLFAVIALQFAFGAGALKARSTTADQLGCRKACQTCQARHTSCLRVASDQATSVGCHGCFMRCAEGVNVRSD